MPDQPTAITRGREKSPTPGEVLEFMEERDRRVWATSTIADRMGFTTTPIRDRLKTLVRREDVEKVVEAGTTLYYPRESAESTASDTRTEEESESLTGELSNTYTHRFLGTEATWEWETASHDDVLAAETIQLVVEPGFSGWTESKVVAGDDRREKLYATEKLGWGVQALITVGVVRKPTTPIEHISYPWDTDLEELAEEHPSLFEPSNEAIFVMLSSVDDVSPTGDGHELTPETGDESGEDQESAAEDLYDSIAGAG